MYRRPPGLVTSLRGRMSEEAGEGGSREGHGSGIRFEEEKRG